MFIVGGVKRWKSCGRDCFYSYHSVNEPNSHGIRNITTALNVPSRDDIQVWCNLNWFGYRLDDLCFHFLLSIWQSYGRGGAFIVKVKYFNNAPHLLIFFCILYALRSCFFHRSGNTAHNTWQMMVSVKYNWCHYERICLGDVKLSIMFISQMRSWKVPVRGVSY